MRSLEKVGWCLALLACTDGLAADFNFDELSRLIRSGSVRTIEETLAQLPPELRANYTLAFSSRSLQAATPAAPRAILFGNDARLIVTFNGDPSVHGYDALETMQFEERSNSFHFREILFPATGGSADISADNPARCAACHGKPARPIWDSPPSWPGMYGERYRAGLSKMEAAGMAAFLASQSSDPRYRHLIGARRFGDRSTYVASPHELYNGGTEDSPNVRLSKLLSSMNVRSLVAELSAAPAFMPHRYALLAAAEGNCGSPPSLFPARLQGVLSVAMANYSHSIATAASAQAAAKRMRRSSLSDSYRAGVNASGLVALRFIAEQLLGLPRQRWSLALEADAVDLASPDGALTIDQVLFERLATNEPQWRDLRSFRGLNATDAYCARLRLRSLQELSEYYGAASDDAFRVAGRPPAPDAMRRPALLDRCISCHDGAVGPALPFGQPTALAARLTAGSYPRGQLIDEILYRLTPQAGAARMPLDVTPTVAQQRELESYFLRLAASQNSGRNSSSATVFKVTPATPYPRPFDEIRALVASESVKLDRNPPIQRLGPSNTVRNADPPPP